MFVVEPRKFKKNVMWDVPPTNEVVMSDVSDVGVDEEGPVKEAVEEDTYTYFVQPPRKPRARAQSTSPVWSRVVNGLGKLFWSLRILFAIASIGYVFNKCGWNGYRITCDLPNAYSRMLQRIAFLERDVQLLQLPLPGINFFSPDLGARIVPQLTSPSDKTARIVRRSNFWVRIAEFWKPDSLVPVPTDTEVLEPWIEAGDCWCGKADHGKVQITVDLPEAVYPDVLIVEHMHLNAGLYPDATPEDIELWVHIPDQEKRLAIEETAQLILPLPTAENESYGTAKALDSTWVLVGAWRYNLYGVNVVQSFPVSLQSLELKYLGIAVQRFSVRVRSNWGNAPYTCIYRLKLHGFLAQEREEVAALRAGP
jgi:hypothetical protein